MTRLEDLQQGAHVLGLVPSSVAPIEPVNWTGEQAIKVIYRTADGTLGDEVARAHATREHAEQVREGPDPATSKDGSGGSTATTTTGTRDAPSESPKPAAQPTAYFGSKRLAPSRVGSADGQIAEEVLQHLSTLPGAEVEVRIEIQAHVAKGIPDQAKRVVGENARALKFDTSGFS